MPVVGVVTRVVGVVTARQCHKHHDYNATQKRESPQRHCPLRGGRFGWVSENERRSRLSESLIKEMTGGDKDVGAFHARRLQAVRWPVWFRRRGCSLLASLIAGRATLLAASTRNLLILRQKIQRGAK